VTIGDNILFNLENSPISSSYSIHSPQKNSISVIPETAGNSLLFKGGLALEPGFYSLKKDDSIASVISVNHSSRELKKPFFDIETIISEIIILDSENYLTQIKNKRFGFELWFFFLILAFLMIISEIVLIKLIEGTPFFKKT